MPKKQLILLLVAIALLGAYIYYFTDSFASESIQIAHSLRPVISSPARPRGRPTSAKSAVNTVSFALNRKCQLTEVKVIPVADLATNQYAHPIWHLVSDSNSVPTKAFVYGGYIRGMHPSVKGATADPLQPDVTYRLFVSTKDLKGEHDFKTTAKP